MKPGLRIPLIENMSRNLEKSAIVRNVDAATIGLRSREYAMNMVVLQVWWRYDPTP